MARRGRRPRSGVVAQQVTALKHAVNGQVLKNLPADPPTHVASPWNSATLSDKYASDGYVSSGNVLRTMQEQLRVPKDFLVDFRVLSCRAWETAGHGLGLYPADLIDSDKDYLARIEDLPGKNQWSRAGYVWPKTHQNRVIAAKTGAETVPIVYLNTPSGDSTQVELYLNVLWRFGGTPLPRMSAALRAADYVLP